MIFRVVQCRAAQYAGNQPTLKHQGQGERSVRYEDCIGNGVNLPTLIWPSRGELSPMHLVALNGMLLMGFSTEEPTGSHTRVPVVRMEKSICRCYVSIRRCSRALTRFEHVARSLDPFYQAMRYIAPRRPGCDRLPGPKITRYLPSSNTELQQQTWRGIRRK